MNIKLLEYLKRYEFQPNKYTSFFTSLTKEEFVQYGPQLIEVEHFKTRLKQALDNYDKICIYSDYDADAITATATMYWGLVLLGFDRDNISFYAPDRFTEGYGINVEAITKLAEINDLIISVDCGINSVLEANVCLNARADLIITDHHVLSGTIPQALAVINPRLTEEYQKNFLARRMRESTFEKYFDKQEFRLAITNDFVSPSICGVGVAWFCLLHLAHYLNANPNILNLLLPFVAIGTIADCQSIRDNQNRLLVKAGIKMFPQSLAQFVGLKALVTASGLADKIQLNVLSSQDLGYTLAPILNAAGRIDHANLAIKLLCTSSQAEADKYALEIIEINNNRKAMVREAVEQTGYQDYSDQPLVFQVTDFSKGIVGLIASKMCEKYNKVAVIISQDPLGYSSASLRAPKGYNLVEIMKNIKPRLLDKFGGHPEAAGFSCANEACEEIEAEFQRILSIYQPNLDTSISYLPQDIILPQLQQQELNKKNVIYINEADFNDSMFNDVSQLEPFGQDFQMPKFLMKLKNYETLIIGKLQNHVKINLKNNSIMCFNITDEDKARLFNNEELYIVFRLSKNIFNYSISNQLTMESIIGL
jgi:single-stranded-DNA-specific exonuclease